MGMIGVIDEKTGDIIPFIEWLNLDDGIPYSLKKMIVKEDIGYSHSGKPSVTKLTGCLKNAYLKMMKPFGITVKGLLTLTIGKMVHGALEDSQDIAEKYVEFITKKGNRCVGYIDDIDLSRSLIADLKTTASLSWHKNRAETNSEDNYVKQVRCYHTMLKRNGLDLANIEIHYIQIGTVFGKKAVDITNKDLFWIRKVEPKDMSEWIEERTDILAEAIRNKIEPKAEPSEDNCKFCDFKSECSSFNNGSDPTSPYN